jgi:hypothetical protein
VGLGHDSPQSRATTLGQQQRLTPPHGRVRDCHVSRESDILQGIYSESGPPWESAGPLDIQPGSPRLVQDPHVYGPDPLEWDSDPPYGVRAAHSRVPRFQDRTHPGLNLGGLGLTRVQTWSGGTYPHTFLLPAQAETQCCHMAYCARHKPTSGT